MRRRGCIRRRTWWPAPRWRRAAGSRSASKATPSRVSFPSRSGYAASTEARPVPRNSRSQPRTVSGPGWRIRQTRPTPLPSSSATSAFARRTFSASTLRPRMIARSASRSPAVRMEPVPDMPFLYRSARFPGWMDRSANHVNPQGRIRESEYNSAQRVLKMSRSLACGHSFPSGNGCPGFRMEQRLLDIADWLPVCFGPAGYLFPHVRGAGPRVRCASCFHKSRRRTGSAHGCLKSPRPSVAGLPGKEPSQRVARRGRAVVGLAVRFPAGA